MSDMRYFLEVDNETIKAIKEISPVFPWQDTALIYIRGSIAEFWTNASQGSGLSLDDYRERVRAIMREGYSLSIACGRARQR